MTMILPRAAAPLVLVALAACATPPSADTGAPAPATAASASTPPDVARRLGQYTTVRLTADLSGLTVNERAMLPLLVDAAREMDAIYWRQPYGDPAPLLAGLDAGTRRLAEINYGPWDRLASDSSFVAGVGPKPAGAQFYPADMTKQEFEAAVARAGDGGAALRSLYTVVRRDASGNLVTTPFHRVWPEATARAAAKLREAARLADDAGLRRYLELRATALETDDYQQSDLAWMDMKSNTIDVVIGPIETYEDLLYGYKAAHEAYVLIKDRAWSDRLTRYAALLPQLQRGIPVREELKRETPGTDSDLNAYDAVFYAGQANAGSKTIAINLPNDEQVQLQKGTRRLQLKNTIRAKFDRILLPIAGELVVREQLPLVTFDAFFDNVMFHEVAHGLGIKNTINGRGTVREALKERGSALEEGKADILGLYMIGALSRQGERLSQQDMNANYVSFLASLFRSIRFGGTSAHGRANIAAFNFLQERGAFARGADGRYRVDFAKMAEATNALAERILTLQGTGDYDGVGAFQAQYGQIGPQLRADLARLESRSIPVDVVFEQGTSVMHEQRVQP